jgi:hypothetical protein
MCILLITGDIMKAIEYLEHSLNQLQKNLKDFLFKCKYKVNSNDFSRERKMGFKDVALFILNMGKRSLQLELNKFLRNIIKSDKTITKQGYLKAREKVKSEMFRDISDSTVKGFYDQCDDYKTWNGYRLSGIDGTKLEIPDTEILRKEFGCAKNESGEVARASATCVYDVLNHLIIKSRITHYKASERDVAIELIKEIISEGTKKDLILFDRGYPSAELISMLIDNKVDFLMRVKSKFSNAVINARRKDQTITILYKQKAYTVRLLRFILDSGEEEVLLTSLLDNHITIEDFKVLYFLRWKIEVKYDDLKNKFEVEDFSGKTKNSIEQDFYATIYLNNMYEFARMKSEATIAQENKNKELKYEYTQNRNILIGTLKDEFVNIVLIENTRKRNKMIRKIIQQLSKSTVPIRPDRHNKRNKFLVHTKYWMHKKRCL